ncbi:MAG: serine/threonine-protein kinase [Planctomycetota bacterium]
MKKSFSEAMKIKHIGSQLLTKSKIQIQELNTLLKETPSEQLTSRVFFQMLLKYRKIQIEDFLEFDQKNWDAGAEELANEETAIIYNLRNQAQNLEFYFEGNPSAQSKTLGKYKIIQEIARGGMGIVYKAYDPKINQTFAIKVLIAGENASEALLKRFHREVQTCQKLIHPGIVQIVDSGEENAQHYFVMEYVEGKTLYQLMREKIDLRTGLEIIEKTLRALHYAHTQGVLHRDLKPENIFVTSSMKPKIGDFGLAKDMTLDSESQQLTQSGFVVGTPIYMSPEQAVGDLKKLDRRADIYSIGVCLYQILTEKKPFDSNTLQNLVYKIVNVPVEAPSRHNPELHSDLDIIVTKALEKDPDRRYSTAEAFADDLKKFLDGKPLEIVRQRKLYQQLKILISLNIVLALLLGGVFLVERLKPVDPIFSSQFGLDFNQHAKDSYLNGGDASLLEGYWKVKWYSEGDPTAHLEQITLDTNKSEILGTATDKTTVAKTYWYHGRLSSKNILTLEYWSQYNTEQASLVGTLFLEVISASTPMTLKGYWYGYSRNGTIIHGTVEWNKLEE